MLLEAADRRQAARAAAFAWLAVTAFIVYGGAIPFHFVWNTAIAAARVRAVLATGVPAHVSMFDVAQNILLYVPFGIFGYLASARGGVRRALWVTALAALLSIATECLQLFTVDRTSSLLDVLTNTGGALAGAAAAPVALTIWQRAAAAASTVHWFDSPCWPPAALALAIVVVSAWEPFDVTLDVGSVAHKVAALRCSLLQRGAFGDELLQAGRYAALVCLGAAWLRALGVRRAVMWAAAASAGLAVGLEATQFFIDSRMPSGYDALVETAGAIAGAALWTAGANRLERRGVFAIIAVWTFVGAAVSMLAPFTRTSSPAPFNWIPFLSAYEFTSANAVSHVLEMIVIYLPVGLAAAWMLPQSATLYALAGSVALAMQAPIESLQAWVPGRYPDITDIALAALGAVAGAWAGGQAIAISGSFRSRRTAAARD